MTTDTVAVALAPPTLLGGTYFATMYARGAKKGERSSKTEDAPRPRPESRLHSMCQYGVSIT